MRFYSFLTRFFTFLKSEKSPEIRYLSGFASFFDSNCNSNGHTNHRVVTFSYSVFNIVAH